MRRRGNKSTKVPNVKLRPAQPTLRTRDSHTQDIWAQDSQLPSDDTGIIDTCPRPFSGIVLCATGVLDKPGLFRQAVELGGTTSNAFTDRVTHLVAKDHGGAKYLCALERKIPILSPEWVTENYKIWLKGDDVDIEESLATYRLPIFSNVILCLSGVDDIKRRTQINKYVTKYGGTFVKNLERPVRVTHLLCSGEQETDKMHYAEKFNRKGEADIKLVWEEWFWDSLEFGGRFDEDKYQVRQPRPERRQRPVEPEPPTPTIPSSEVLDNAESMPRQRPNPNPTDDDEEPAAMKRVPAVQLQLWASLLKPRGFEVDAEQGRLVRSPTKSQARAKRREEEEEEEEDSVRVAGASKSFLGSAGFRRNNSFAPLANKSIRRILSTRKASPLPEADYDGQGVFQDMQMDVDTPGAGPSTPSSSPPPDAVKADKKSDNLPPVAQAAKVDPKPAQESPTPPIFSGRKFLLLGEADSAGVRDAIHQRGGSFLDGPEACNPQHENLVDFVVVRLASGSNLLPSSASPSFRRRFRTECWLEQCIFEDHVCEPDQHVSFTPIGIPCPIEGANSVYISFSGLDESERYFMTRLVKALGLNLLPTFSKRATHLLCPPAEGLKYEKAKEWGVPVVNMAWVETLKATGRVPGVGGYLVPGQDITTIKTGKAKVVLEETKKDVKGKGKAVVEDPRMADITNGQSQSQTQDDSQPLFEFKPQVTSTQKQPLVDDVPPIPSLSNLQLSSPAGSFGKPNGLLCNPIAELPPPQQQLEEYTSPAVTQPPADTQTPDLSSIPPPRDKGKGKERVLVGSRSEPAMNSSPAMAHPLAKRSATEANISGKDELDIDLNSVPSSRTPSPVKMSSAARDRGVKRKSSNGNMKGRGRGGFSRKKSGSMSPSKGGHHERPMEIDEERAKALQESVTNLLNGNGGGVLLGKRRSEEGERGGEGNGGASVERMGKRPRPIRKTRAQPQQPQAAEPYPHGREDELNLEFGGGVEVEEQVEFAEDSLRVTYEDPGQENEKRKLMQLFEKEDGDSDFEIVSVSKVPEKPASASTGTRRKGRKTRS
ncbi:protein kinase activating protein dpb11 [Marasmius crinis-equi]|uniref:Protein kinase activating protein dpb11 n=1 Tax=Marasmius crinis-equi TaxID=585013 RepID=A0ABR3FUA0_9AGAR